MVPKPEAKPKAEPTTQPDGAAPEEPVLTDMEKREQARAKAMADETARLIATAEGRTRYAQLVDLIRGSATPEELQEACESLRPIAQKVQARL